MVGTSRILVGMDPEIPTSDYREIEELIASDDSPVGIDAKKTHIIILHKLLRIEARLEQLESLVGRGRHLTIPAPTSGQRDEQLMDRCSP